MRNSIEPFIYTVPDTSFDQFGDNLSYRDKRAIDLVPSRVHALTVTVAGEPPLDLERSPGGTWTAENAKTRQVDSTKTDSQVAILSELQVQRWLGPSQPSYGLDQPVLTFAIKADKPAATVLKDRRTPCPTAPMPRRCRAHPTPSPCRKPTSAFSTPARSSSSPRR